MKSRIFQIHYETVKSIMKSILIHNKTKLIFTISTKEYLLSILFDLDTTLIHNLFANIVTRWRHAYISLILIKRKYTKILCQSTIQKE